ncbi:MAG TPA: Kdo hydroxylase family protein [Vicinamibacteria bacterium]|nr:Kdo hydroxylase family protein [Vicinamibacteria bacterium]
MSQLVVEEVAPGTDCRRSLEEGRILLFPPSALQLPAEDVAFLLSQRQSGARYHKNIAYRPAQDRISGVAGGDGADAERLRRVLADYSRRAVEFTGSVLPDYARAWKVDYASFRPVEEQGRELPVRARNDLVHVDAFPTRPSGGDRILRVFTNVNPQAPRVWLSAGTFEDLAGRFAVSSGLLAGARRPRLSDLFRRLGLPVRARSPYDRFMLSFHHFLKENRAFQEQADDKTRLSFPPGSTWMVFTDMVSHAVLSGRFALEQTFMVARETLALPERAPIAILERIAGAPMS